MRQKEQQTQQPRGQEGDLQGGHCSDKDRAALAPPLFPVSALTPFPCVLPLNMATVPACAPCSGGIMASCLLLTTLVRHGWLLCDQPSADPRRC